MDFGDLFIFSNFSVDLTLHFVRVLCTALIATSWCAPRSGQETRQDVPSWNSLGTPLALPRYKAKQEIDVSNFHAVLQGRHHARQAKNSKSRYGAKK
ncbi:MAG: hypothetical protein IJW09_03225 [Clostridia bacterium]|nr:hypothetical protein [Clostridia bacterium]